MSVLNGLKSSRTRPVVCIFDKGVALNVTSDDVMKQSWPDSIREHDTPGIGGASDMELVMSETITSHFCKCQKRPRMKFRIMDKMIIQVLLEMAFTGRFSRSIRQAESKIVTQHSPPVPILLVRKEKRKAEQDASYICQVNNQDLAQLVKPTRRTSTYSTGVP